MIIHEMKIRDVSPAMGISEIMSIAAHTWPLKYMISFGRHTVPSCLGMPRTHSTYCNRFSEILHSVSNHVTKTGGVDSVDSKHEAPRPLSKDLRSRRPWPHVLVSEQIPLTWRRSSQVCQEVFHFYPFESFWYVFILVAPTPKSGCVGIPEPKSSDRMEASEVVRVG